MCKLGGGDGSVGRFGGIVEEISNNSFFTLYPHIDILKVKDKFLNHKNSCSHFRHLSKEDCRSVGLNIIDLEEFPQLNDAVMSLHNCYMIMIDKFQHAKIVENQKGEIYIYRTM